VKFVFNYRIACAALLAFVIVTMQSAGLVHRIAHGPSAGSAKDAAHELWLVVANGGEVSATAWLDAQSHERDVDSDPWHAHDEAADCERFDALCAASALLSHAEPPRLPAPASFTQSRVHLALLTARTPHAQARAPPLA
jgi:hypothetical protein